MTENFDRQTFGSNVSYLIDQMGWSVQYTANQIGYNRIDLSAVLTGRKNFKLSTIIKIAQFFNVSVFLLFSRLFSEPSYQKSFPFVDTDYMQVIQKNFRSCSAKQANVALDTTTVSHILHGRRTNITIATLEQLAAGAGLSVSDLLKTAQDTAREKSIKEDLL